MPPTYDEATVMWRMQRGHSLHAHAVIGVTASGTVLVWFVNGHPLGFRDFSDVGAALRWSDQLQAQNWAAGWRLVSD